MSPRSVIHGFSRYLALGSAFSLLGMVLIVTADVAGRELLESAVPGVITYSEVLMVFVVYLGVAHAQATNSHVGVTVVRDRLPPRLSAALYACGLATAGLLVAWLLYETSLQAWSSFESRESSVGLVTVPVWPARVALAVGFLALLVELMLTTVDAVRDAFLGHSELSLRQGPPDTGI